MRFLICFFWLLALPAYAVDPFYEVDQLNAGLAQVPDKVSRDTPQATMESFLDLAKVQNFEAAAHVLNLNAFDTSEQTKFGADLARQFYVLLDRKVVIDWDQLMDRSDALDASATSDSAVAGQTRRSLMLWTLDLKDRTVPIRMNRVKAADASAVWVFSEQTVENIPALYELYQPSKFERMLPNALRKDAFWNLMYWEVICLPLLILLAIASGILAQRVLKRAAGKSSDGMRAQLIHAIRTPVIIAVVTSVFAVFAKSLFVFSGGIDTLLNPAITLGYVLFVLMLAINVLDVILDALVQFEDDELKAVDTKDKREMATKVSAARRALIVVIFLFGAGLVLSSANVFKSFGFSLLASAGAITLVLAFAARKVLGNIMASMQIAMNQSARIGDKIQFRDYLCNVERINFTYVQLRVWTGIRLIVPVEEFVAEPFENWSLQEPELLQIITLHLSHTADVEKLRDAFYEVVKQQDQEQVGTQDDLNVVVTNQDVFGKEVSFCLPCANPNTAWQLSCNVREALIAKATDMETDDAPIFPQVNPAQAI